MGEAAIKRQIRNFRRRAKELRRSKSVTGTVGPDFTLHYDSTRPGTMVTALPPIPDRSHWDLEPGWRLKEAQSFRKPKGGACAGKGKAIPYCSKFYRATLYEPEPNLNLKEMMSWVDPPPS